MTEYTIKYPIGSVVYIIRKAKRGLLEKISIKKFNVNVNNDVVIVYTDTLNRIWIEFELCPKSEAVDLATAYYERLLAEAEALEG